MARRPHTSNESLTELFLDMLAAERGASANTLDAYRRDLADFSADLDQAGGIVERQIGHIVWRFSSVNFRLVANDRQDIFSGTHYKISSVDAGKSVVEILSNFYTAWGSLAAIHK